MNNQDRIVEIFRKMPGIGPRQAKRMAYYLLSTSRENIEALSSLIAKIQDDILICSLCYRYFNKSQNKNSATDANGNIICSICADEHRNRETMMIVAKDVDLDVVEKSGQYSGVYFVFGGTVPFMAKNSDEGVRMREILKTFGLRAKSGLREIIFAFNANPEGEHTTSLLEQKLKEYLDKNHLGTNIKFSKLGRGFSTGTEVEYSDKETIKNAIATRS
jgi:recombination protein RecR